MKILHILHRFPPMSLGGTEINAYLLARAQAARHEVHAVFPYAWAPQESPHFPHRGIHLSTLPLPPKPPLRKLWEPLSEDPDRERRALEILDRVAPDLLHIHHLQGIPIAMIERAVERGIPLFFTLRDYWYGCARTTMLTHRNECCAGPRADFSNCAECWTALALEKMGLPQVGVPSFGLLASAMQERAARFLALLNRAKVAFAPSRFLLGKHAAFGVERPRLRYLPNGVDVAPYRDFRRTPADAVRFGYLGSITPEKGVHVAVEAARLAGRELRVFGGFDPREVPYHAELQRNAGPTVRFLGKVENPAEAFAQIDGLVVPSVWYENCPGVILQARATKTAVIASDLGALPEMVRPGVDGLLFPPGDARALADSLAVDRPTLRSWGDAGPQPLSIEEHAERVLDAYATP